MFGAPDRSRSVAPTRGEYLPILPTARSCADAVRRLHRTTDAALRKPLVELSVLGQDAICRRFELRIARQFLDDARLKQVLNRNSAILRALLELGCDLVRQRDFD